MNRNAIRSGNLNKLTKVGAWFRAGYPTDAPQFGHAALIALCPTAVRVQSALRAA